MLIMFLFVSVYAFLHDFQSPILKHRLRYDLGLDRAT